VILIVKSPFALPAFAIATLALLSACGQPGPLYMPKPPVRAAAPAAQPPAATAPAPVTSVTPPAPAAGMIPPVAGSNGTTTQAPQSTPPTQQ
jgi:predicted small lipoprotein YifL